MDEFEHIYKLLLFLAITWIMGKLFARCRLPALVGEILTGIIFGPQLLNFIDNETEYTLKIIGEIGLVFLVLEAGLDVDIEMLKIVGNRGMMIAIISSIIPFIIAFILSSSSMVVAICLTPSSMGIALNVLRSGKILNTMIGQLIIAGAIFGDMIALILLSELSVLAMKQPKWFNILSPFIISPALLLLFGFVINNYFCIARFSFY